MPDKVAFTFTADASEFKKELDVMKQQLSALSTAQRGAAKSLGSMSGIMKGAAALWGVGALKSAMSAFYDTVVKGAAEAEKSAVSFKVLMGDAAAAGKQVDDLKAYAAETPFAFDDIAAADKKLLAFGVDAAKSQKVIRQLGDIASVSGASLEELAAVYGKMAVTGVSLETINQLSERGVNVLGTLAKIKGVSAAQVAKMVSDKKVGLADIDAVLADNTGRGGRFYNGTMQLSQTLEGKISTLKDNISAVTNAFGEGFVTALKEPIDNLTRWVASNKQTLNDWGKGLADCFAYVATHAKEIAAAVASMAGVWAAFKAAGAWPAVVSGAKTLVSALGSVVSALGVAGAAVAAAFAAIAGGIAYVTKLKLDENERRHAKNTAEFQAAADAAGSPVDENRARALEILADDVAEIDRIKADLKTASAVGDASAMQRAEGWARQMAGMMRERQHNFAQGDTRTMTFALIDAEKELEKEFIALAKEAKKARKSKEEADALAALAAAEEERKVREKRKKEFEKRLAEESPEADALYRRVGHAKTPLEKLRGFTNIAAEIGVPWAAGSDLPDLLEKVRAERDRRGLAGDSVKQLDKLLAALDSFSENLYTLGETRKQTLLQHAQTVGVQTLENRGQEREAEMLRDSYAYLQRVTALMQQGFDKKQANDMAAAEISAAMIARERQKAPQHALPTVYAQSGVSVGNGGAYIRLGGQQVSVAQQQLQTAQATNRYLENIRATVDRITAAMTTQTSGLPVI